MDAIRLNEVINSPVWVSKLINSFVSGACSCNSKGVKFELVYFLLPLINSDLIFNKLVTLKKTSTIYTLLNSHELKNDLLGISNLIIRYQYETEDGIIYCSDTIDIDTYIRVSENKRYHYKNENNTFIRSYMKASYNLGIIFSKENPCDIVIKLGLS